MIKDSSGAVISKSRMMGCETSSDHCLVQVCMHACICMVVKLNMHADLNCLLRLDYVVIVTSVDFSVLKIVDYSTNF